MNTEINNTGNNNHSFNNNNSNSININNNNNNIQNQKQFCIPTSLIPNTSKYDFIDYLNLTFNTHYHYSDYLQVLDNNDWISLSESTYIQDLNVLIKQAKHNTTNNTSININTNNDVLTFRILEQ